MRLTRIAGALIQAGMGVSLGLIGSVTALAAPLTPVTPTVISPSPRPSASPSPSVSVTSQPLSGESTQNIPAPDAPAVIRTLPNNPTGSNPDTRTSATTRPRSRVRSSWLDGFYFDAGIVFGNARPTIPGVADEPFLLQLGLNATLAYRVYAFLLGNSRVTLSAGLTPDYRFSGQYSSLDPTIGNFRGTRFQLFTPTVVARIEDQWTLKLGIELSGPYNLSRPTFNGNSLDFGSPFGISLSGEYSLAKVLKIPNLYGGLQLEYVTFGNIEDSALGTSSLSSAIKFLEFGIAVSYVF